MIKNILSSNKNHVFGYLVLSIVVAVCARTAGDDVRAPRTIEANQFVLRDANGKARAGLSVFNNDTLMSFFDSNGKTGLALGVRANGTSFIDLKNPTDDHARISMRVLDGVPHLSFRDTNGNMRISLQLLPNNSAALNFMNKDKILFSLGVLPDEGSTIILNDNAGKLKASISVNNKDVDINMYDSKEKPRISIGVDAVGDPKLQLLDGEGKALFDTPR